MSHNFYQQLPSISLNKCHNFQLEYHSFLRARFEVLIAYSRPMVYNVVVFCISDFIYKHVFIESYYVALDNHASHQPFHYLI